MDVTIYTDGASRGNPGPAAAAFRILSGNKLVVEHAEKIGTATNNVAEYTAMILALTRATALGARRVALNSDSELMVKQMRGEYRVKHPDIIPLYEQARVQVRSFSSVAFNYVPRSQNADADRLCNDVLDDKQAQAKRRDSTVGNYEERIIDLLTDAAVAWAKTGEGPDSAELWQQIRDILVKAGQIKKSGKS